MNTCEIHSHCLNILTVSINDNDDNDYEDDDDDLIENNLWKMKTNLICIR